MNVWLTFDYELFFGARTCSIEKCMLEPTKRLLELSQRFHSPTTFFVDAGFLWKLNELAPNHPELREQHEKIASQLREIIAQGSDVQLHIHPHWELTDYADGKWQIPQNQGYRLAEFSNEEAKEIFEKYKNHLDAIIERKSIAYRAGGWCIQPFNQIQDVFESSGLIYDSSVVPGMRFQAGVYDVDFTQDPRIKMFGRLILTLAQSMKMENLLNYLFRRCATIHCFIGNCICVENSTNRDINL